MQERIHPLALGVEKFKESPFVRPLSGGRLSIVRVLLDSKDGPSESDIQDLPRESARRPSVYCPFCGREGKYSFTEKYRHFSHLSGQEDCVLRDLETALHRRAKSLLLEEIARARGLGRSLDAETTCTRCNKSYRKSMCKPGMWDSEEAERSLPDGLRPDISMFLASSPAFLIEVYVTHLVDPEKRKRLETLGIAGVEIDARHLFDEQGNQLWTCEQSLPLPINSWALERAPRRYNICPKCRAVPSSRKLAASVAACLSQADPDTWASVLVAGSISGAWLRGLEQRPREILLELTEVPERLRDDSQIPAHEMSADEIESKIFAGLRAHYGADALDYWENLADLAKNVFGPLAGRVFELSADISGKTEQIDAEIRHLGQALRLAERIHNALGDQDTQFRPAAWVGYGLLQNSSRYGNTCMKEERLLAWPGRDIHGLTPEILARWVDQLVEANCVVRISDMKPVTVALRSLAVRERGIVFELIDIFQRGKGKLRSTLSQEHRALNPLQRRAVEMVAASPITIVHGAAGTGKSRVIRGIVKTLPQLDWILLAPTGKAAARLREGADGQTGCWRPMTFAKFVVSQDNEPTPPDERVYGVILDEVGFASAEDFDKLLKSLNRLSVRRLVLLGDPKQLPSIGPGSVLGDLIKWARRRPKGVAAIELTEVMRSTSQLTLAARDVRFGRSPAFVGAVTRADPEVDIKQQVLNAIRYLRDLGSETVQVIVRTRVLVHELNLALQSAQNSFGRALACASHLRIGDTVICTENYYGRDFALLNGQQAEIIGESNEEIVLISAEERICLPVSEVKRLMLGYVITVHKAQGSEWDSAVIVFPNTPGKKGVQIKNSLIYTALTRSRNGVHIISRQDTLDTAIQERDYRKTLLQHFLEKHWPR